MHPIYVSLFYSNTTLNTPTMWNTPVLSYRSGTLYMLADQILPKADKRLYNEKKTAQHVTQPFISIIIISTQYFILYPLFN